MKRTGHSPSHREDAAARQAADGAIRVRGARQHNLKGLDLDLPLGELIVVTGVSGSGKSSLAFDTLYAEGQRRYVETFSPYARQFLERMDRPQADRIEGIPPAIAIDQTNPVRTSRSTVGTMTELADHLKLLYARTARLYCAGCGREVRRDTPQGIVAETLARLEGRRVAVTFPVEVPASLSRAEVEGFLARAGWMRVLRRRGGRLEVVQDRLRVEPGARARLGEAVEAALAHGHGHVRIQPLGADRRPEGPPLAFSSDLHCPDCDRHYREPTPGLFSFNSAVGACPTCRGFGRVIGVDWDLVVPDPSLSLAEGAIRPFQGRSYAECQDDLLRFARARGIPVDVPWRRLTAAQRRWVLEGEGDFGEGVWYGVRRFFRWLEGKSYKMHIRVLLSRYRSYETCPDCRGARLKDEALAWRLGTRADADAVLEPAARIRPRGFRLPLARYRELPGLALHELARLPIAKARAFFERLRLPAPLDQAAELLLGEIRTRLAYLDEVGLGYLTLDRQSRTLSGGEVQRINLTTALGASLVNTLFVLDEPTVGLHPRDTGRLLAVLRRLREAGNTLVVVEHDPQVMRAADRIVDLGPGPGEQGGRIVCCGPPGAIAAHPESLTGRYLRGERRAWSVRSRRAPDAGTRWLEVRGARAHNLKGIDVAFPLGRLVCVTGVSGSGKSTLVETVLHRALARLKGQGGEAPGRHRAIRGHRHVAGSLLVDQSPIGRTARSCPASYVGAWDAIRRRFAAEPEARARGYTAGTFSFNAGSGRCPTCAGSGFEHVEMQFLSDVYLRCPDCDGRRYRPEVLEIALAPPAGSGLAPANVADVLEMTVDAACAFFADDPEVLRRLEPLRAVGLGYLRLGQPVPTLSGGEAQRLKLAGHLAKAGHGGDGGGLLFLFDEPTTGLHPADVEVLLQAFQRLIDAGHSVIVVEHNLDVIAAADWIVDLGPDGGDAGGRLVAAGTVEDLMACAASHTGRALREHLEAAARTRPRGRRGRGGGLRGTRGPSLALGAGRPWPATPAHPASPPFPGVAEGEGNRCGSPGPGLSEPGGGAAAPPQAPLLGPPHARREDGAGAIRVLHAREHNLKGVSVDIPRDRLVVVTGVSGSGKSTLAFDIVFAEGQRRYLESLNAYARQFVQPAARADVDAVHGIPPTVAIEQRTSRGGRKSTVGTLTEIHHYLRLLYVRLGVQHCPDCGVPVEKRSPEAIAARLLREWRGRELLLLAPLVVARKGVYNELARWAAARGHAWLRVDGARVPTDPWPRLDRYREHTIELPVAELRVGPRAEGRLREALAAALKLGRGVVHAAAADATGPATVLSARRACPRCGRGFPEPDPRLFSYSSRHGWCPRCYGTGELLAGFDAEQTGEEIWWNEWFEGEARPCPACGGRRLRPEALAVRFHGRGIAELSALPVRELARWFARLRLGGREADVARDVVAEVRARLAFLERVGLGYLPLDRGAPTLSGGEAQRIRLAAQLGSNLRGVCYVLDEPTIGLHPRDNALLLETLEALRDRGNTVLVVEHDEETILRAEHVIDLGPGAGARGGFVVAQGTVADIRRAPESVTGRMLADPPRHPLPGLARRPPPPEDEWLVVEGACLHNLKGITVRFPLGRLVCVTGVSGSGKSTLVREVLAASLARLLARGRRARAPVGCAALGGHERLGRVLEVDQTPIGKTPRSCPATYVGLFDEIRRLYAATTEARLRGWKPGRFSFNVAGGRCEACEGQGVRTVAMSFLPDVKVTCEACGGSRYAPETLEARWNGRSIAEVLAMSVDEAAGFFAAHPRIRHPLELLRDVGLGYLTLGQPSPTLSGGEAQRIKLVTELARVRPQPEGPGARRRAKPTLYVLDEPTVGLHMADVEKLVRVLHRLVEAGHTVVVIEHNLDVVAEADWIVDLGPEGGDGGGRIVAEGPPERVARRRRGSHTARALAAFLAARGR